MKRSMIKKLMVAMLLPSVGLVSAQETKEYLNTTGDNWYIEAGAGTQMLFAKDADALDFGDRLTPYISLTVGKWVSPWMGFRLQAQGYGLNGNSTTEGLFTATRVPGSIYGTYDPVREHVTVRPDGSYRYDTRYFNLHADFQASLFNLIAPNKNHRVDLIPAVGLGWYRQLSYKGTPNVNSISANFAMMLKVAVWKGLDVNVEVSSAVLPDAFDGRIAGKAHENTLAASVGLTWNFGRKPFKKNVETKYVDREVIRTVRDTVYQTRTETKVVEKQKKVEPFALSTILFKIDNDMPEKGQDVQYANIVKYLEANPSTKVRLDGYADSITGTPDYNLHLSIRRAISVKNILVDDYGVDESRIEAQGIGVNAQPYSVNKLNRAVVVTIIER